MDNLILEHQRRVVAVGSKLKRRPFITTLTATGTGAGVSTLRLWTSEDITLTLDGTARFYDNLAGTTNEGLTRTVVAGAMRTFYLRCPSGTANMVWSDATKVLRWGDNTIDGWVSSTNAASIAGNIEALTNLTYLRVLGSNTLSGSVAGLTNLTYLYVSGSNTLEFPNVTNITRLCYLQVHTTVTLTSENVNQLLADFWLNRDAPKPRAERTIDIRGSSSSGGPTGQGITDATNLAAYRSPDNNPANALWTVLTR